MLAGAIFFAISLTPSLVPRPYIVQGVVSGLSMGAGYALGVACGRVWAYLELPLPGAWVTRIIKLIAIGLCILIAIGFLWLASTWQNSLRALMQMEAATGGRPISIAAIALVVFLLLLLVGRLFWWTFRFLSDMLHRFVPRRVSRLMGAVAAVALFWSIANGVIFRLALRAADSSYQQVDALITDDLNRPDDPAKAGSPESLIAWADLGQAGRYFVSSGSTAEEISAFTGEPAMEPIRVYVGLNAAPTPRERAQLALQELIRVNAFDRSVLILATPTGTGWIDAAAQNPVEYLHHGDIATVAAQYSYLPSALALVVEGGYGVETARAMFEEIYGYWTTLPRDDRPKLYLYGLSLGALLSDLSFDLHDILADPFHGALWVGPPFRSESWQEITADREPGSLAWLPRFRGGSVVRFMNQDGMPHAPVAAAAEARWGPMRLLYLQYASDPITFFSIDTAWREPEWMRKPRGPDVSPQLRWFPIVTMLQLGADMIVGGAPPGYGHEYATEDYLAAWVALMEPQGWTDEDLARLAARHAKQP